MLYEHRIEKLPLVDDEGKLIGMITAQDIEKREQFVNAAKDANGQLRVGAAIGVGPDCFERAVGAFLDLPKLDSPKKGEGDPKRRKGPLLSRRG